MARFILAPAALRDLRDIKDYLVRERGVTSAREVLRRLTGSMRMLGEMPGLGHLREDLTEEPVLFWAVGTYLVIYRKGSRPVEVVRVLHGARDVSSLLDDD